MVPFKLNNNEQMVMYGLVRYPEASDLELSNLIGVKRPTITKIRNKIFNLGFVETYYVPNFQALGMEMLVFWRGRYNTKVLLENDNISPKSRQYNIISVHSGMEGMGMSTFHNFTEYRKNADKYICELMEHGALKNINDIQDYFHPFELSHIDTYFDYARVVRMHFNLDTDDSNEPYEYPKRLKPDLTEKEKIILISMVENPGLSDSKLSSLLGISRPTVSEKRNGFIQKQIIRKRNLPNIRLINTEVVAQFNFQFASCLSDNQRKKVAGEVLDTYTPFIQLHGRLDCTGMFIAKKFEDLKRWNDEFLFPAVDDGKINENINFSVIPINNVKVRVTNLAPTLRYALGVPEKT